MNVGVLSFGMYVLLYRKYAIIITMMEEHQDYARESPYADRKGYYNLFA